MEIESSKLNKNEANEMSYGPGGKHKQTKVERYGWSVLDEPGTPLKIIKTKLKIDPSYQRNALKKQAILRIASNWSWVAFNAISVADRDGEYFVIDGQQRVSAALKRADISALPCMVFKSLGIKDEAIGFLRLNTERSAVKFIDKLKAMILSGDETAIMVQEMAEDCGRVISNNSDSSSIKCAKTIYRNLKLYKKDTEEVWPLIVKICEGHPILDRVVDGLVYIQKYGNESIVGTKWEKKLIEIGFRQIIRACQESSAYYAKGGQKVWALGIVKLMNKGMRNLFYFKNDSQAQ